MKAPLHILHLEDDLADAALIQATLGSSGIACEITCVQTQPEFVAALEQGDIQLILSDFSLPKFDGLSALALVRERWPAIPVILVSGTLGEELAVESFKSGATDYVLKDRLIRLAPAVRRAMHEVDERSDRQRIESQFIQAQKMQVIGQLAGGVAHDFNNILSVILGYADLITSSLEADSPLTPFAEEIRHASERAAGLTRQLLVFSRKQTVQPIVLDLNGAILDFEKMLRRLLDENIELAIIPGKDTGRVRIDSGYVGQLLMNLVVNARDAMPAGGKITIATKSVLLDEHYAATHPGAVPGSFVLLSVSDTGSGITPEVQARMFEAFFTTKPQGKGTGLGLATCQMIVQQSGGQIGVYSEVGKGATFKIYLPQVEQAAARASGALLGGPAPRGTETLLVVEDEPALRNLACRVLETQGYQVLSAAHGEEALEIARDHRGSEIRLVITDVIMPLMGGRELAQSLQTLYPGVKVLFTSGYTDDAIARHGVLEPGVEFLAKPYTAAHLAHKVRELLDQSVGKSTPPGPVAGPT